MAIYALQPGQPQQIIYAASSQRQTPITEYTITNLDDQFPIYLGAADASAQQPDLTADLCRDILQPLQSVTVRATLDWWALNSGDVDPVQVDVIPEGISQSTSAIDTATALITAGVPLAIAEQLSAAGLPLPPPKLLYNIGPSGPTIAGQWGATVYGAAGQSFQSAFTSFESVTGTTITTFKIYNTVIPMTPAAIAGNTFIQFCIANPGVRACLCFQPALDGSDAANLATSYANLKAAGLNNAAIVFWQEWQNQGITAAQIQAVYAAYYAGVQAVYPGACVYDPAGSKGVSTWTAGDPAPNADIYAIDLYATAYYASPQNDPIGIVNLAHSHNKPWAIFEMGASVGNQVPPTQAKVKSYISYITSLVTADLDLGKPVDSCMWYYQPQKNVNNDPAPYVAEIQALAAALTVGGVTPTTVPAGGTLNLTPLVPSPVAGYSLAQALSYDVLINLVSTAAGSTNPFCRIRFLWYNSDDPNARPVDIEQWALPIGASGTNGTQIWGRGPQRGQFLRVEALNSDTLSCQIQCQVNATSRTVSKDDLRWDVTGSVAVPGFQLANTGGAYIDSLGNMSSVSVAAGSSVSKLFSLFAGQAWVRFATDAPTAVISVTMTPQPNSLTNGTPILNELISSSGEFVSELILPRAPCVVKFSNADSVSRNVFAEVISLDPGG